MSGPEELQGVPVVKSDDEVIDELDNIPTDYSGPVPEDAPRMRP